MPSQYHAHSERQAQRTLERARLGQLLEARALAQRQLAHELHVAPSEISKIAQCTDMYVGTLASFLAGMGVDLRIEAVFPDGRVIRIDQFEGSA